MYDGLRVDVAIVEPLYDANVGYVARAMKNFGLTKLYLVNPRCPLGDNAIKYSSHARDIVLNATKVDSLDSLVDRYDLVVGTTGKKAKRRSPIRRHVTPRELVERLRGFSGRVLLVFGREDIGLTNEELSICDLVVIIQADPGYPILNLSHAATIIFYELYNGIALGDHAIRSSAELPKREEIKVLMQYVDRVLRRLGKGEHVRRKATLILRRIIGSCRLSSSDVRLLITIVKGAYEASSRQA